MFDLGELMTTALAKLFTNIFENITTHFANELADVFQFSQYILELDFIKNTVKYSQALAITLLSIKVMYEVFQTYILHQNGDPDADPTGVLIRTTQAIAIIACVPSLVEYVFTFGSKVATDIANINGGTAGIVDWSVLTAFIVGSQGIIVAIIGLAIAISTLIIIIQSIIRGAELALMSVIGPILALNITANNRGSWNAWFKQLIILCTSQALQIFMFKGAMSLITNELSNGGFLFIFGWLWVTVLTPKFLQQFLYTSGVTETGQRFSSAVLTRKIIMTK